MELVSAYHSDLEFLLDMYLKWFNSGSNVYGNFCSFCNSKVYMANKNKGCKRCRTNFSNNNRLNNKILENILIVKENVFQIISKSSLFKNQNPINCLYNVPLTEVIGRSLISSFPEQVAEFLLPENPDAGLHLLNNGTKGSLSTTSAFAQRQQTNIREIIAMKITEITQDKHGEKNTFTILDQVHPMDRNWFPAKHLLNLIYKSKNMIECLVYPNISGRYGPSLGKLLREEFPYAVIAYDNINSLLKVYAPKNERDFVKKFCLSKIEEQKEQETKYETIIDVYDRTLKVTFGVGMEIKKVEKIPCKNTRYYLSIWYNGFLSQNTVEKQLSDLGITPIRVKNFYANRKYLIFVNNFPPAFSEKDIKESLNFVCNNNILIKKNKFNYYYAILEFYDPDDQKRAIRDFKNSRLASMNYVFRGKTYYPTFEPKDDFRFPANESEFQIVFNTVEEADLFCSTYGYEGEGYLTLKIFNDNYWIIKDLLPDLKYSYGIEVNIEESKGNSFFIKISGQYPREIGETARQIMKKLAQKPSPMYVNVTSSLQIALINEIEREHLLKQWAREYGVTYTKNCNKTNDITNLEVNGDQKNQQGFLREIKNYLFEFQKRFISIPLPTNANFLFKKGRVCLNFIDKFNKNLWQKGSLRFNHHKNSLELYLKPGKEEETYDISKQIRTFVEKLSDQAVLLDYKNFESCVFCSKKSPQTFFICGHSFCSNCLLSETKEKLEEGEKILCKKCKTPISVQDVRKIFDSMNEFIIVAESTVKHYLKTKNMK